MLLIKATNNLKRISWFCEGLFFDFYWYFDWLNADKLNVPLCVFCGIAVTQTCLTVGRGAQSGALSLSK